MLTIKTVPVFHRGPGTIEIPADAAIFGVVPPQSPIGSPIGLVVRGHWNEAGGRHNLVVAHVAVVADGEPCPAGQYLGSVNIAGEHLHIFRE